MVRSGVNPFHLIHGRGEPGRQRRERADRGADEQYLHERCPAPVTAAWARGQLRRLSDTHAGIQLRVAQAEERPAAGPVPARSALSWLDPAQ